jgi:hypothetical protein
MNMKTFKVWNTLLNNPNEWLHVFYICEHAGLTSKQVVRILSGFHSPLLLREHRSDGTYVCINATDSELQELRNEIVKEFYDISMDFIETIESVLLSIGWVSLTDIAYDTGLKPQKISAALSTMDNVIQKTIGNTHVYAKVK